MDSGGGKSSNYNIGNTAKPKDNKRIITASGQQIFVCTYNVKSLLSDDRLKELEKEIEPIKWDIIGIGEVRRRGEKCVKLQSGHTLFYKGQEDKSEGGVGLLINKKIANNVIQFIARTHRIIYIIIKISSKFSLKIIQVYAPTSDYEDEEVESFYEEITQCIEENHTQYTLIIGDLNAKVGKKEENTETCIGDYGIDIRNRRGHMLVNFSEKTRMYIMNTFFKKKKNRKWSWRSPDGKTKNEIDFIISSHKNIIRDVSVLNTVNVGSDHRLVRSKLCINGKLERSRQIRKAKRCIEGRKILQNKDKYGENLTKELKEANIKESDNLEDKCEKITESMVKAMEKMAKVKPKVESKLSKETEDMMKERREMAKTHKRYTTGFTELNKRIRTAIKDDLRLWHEKKIEEALTNSGRTKEWRRQKMLGRDIITAIRDQNGNLITDQNQILQRTEQFYEQLYDTKINPTTIFQDRKITNVNSEEIPDIEMFEIEKALKQIKNEKSAGEDGILPEMLKAGGDQLMKQLKNLFNQCLQEEKIPANWHNAVVVLLHKKGDKTRLENYRPISLLSQIYKLLTKILTTRLTVKFDQYQACEQAGFRKGFGTNDHIQVVRSLIEKTQEYNMPLYLIFVDFEKAFDSIETLAILNSLQNSRIDHRYTNLIKNIYDMATLTVKLHTQTNPIKMKKGVRQGDTISPKLFTLCLEDIFKKLNWDDKGINVNGRKINHLTFADDVLLIADNIQDLQKMLTELQQTSMEVGLKINHAKTKAMNNEGTKNNVILENNIIEEVESHIYLGQTISMSKKKQEEEINRRISQAWRAFSSWREVFKSNIEQNLKTKLFNQNILPVLTYAAETWTLTKRNKQLLATTQRAMERSMLKISLRDRQTNTWIRGKTKVEDVIERALRQKWRWAGHVARLEDNRWTKVVVEWRPRQGKRFRGRPPMRWTDDIKRVANYDWMQKAKDRHAWKILEEAYIQAGLK